MTEIASAGGGAARLVSAARLLAFLTGPLAYATPLAMAAVLPVLTLLMALITWRRGVDWRAMLRPALPWLPLLVLMPLSALWSIAPGASLLLSLRLTVILLCGLILADGIRRLPAADALALLRALAWGFLIASVAVISEAIDGQVLVRLFNESRADAILLSHYSRGGDVAAFVIVPLAFGLWRNGARRLALAFLILGAAAILLGWEASSKLALIVGLVAGAAVLAAPRLRWLLVAALALAALIGPWALPVTISPSLSCWLTIHKPSGLHRLIIWNFVDGKIRERPWLGYGLDGARRLPGGRDPVKVETCNAPPGSTLAIDNQLLPLHPHNAVLQIWLELGGIGALAAFGALVASLVRAFSAAHAESRSAHAMLAAFTAAALGPGFLSFGIWQEWWASSLLIGIAMVAALGRVTHAAKDSGASRDFMLERAAGPETPAS